MGSAMRRGGTCERSENSWYHQFAHGCSDSRNNSAMFGVGRRTRNLPVLWKLAPPLGAGCLAFVARDVGQSGPSTAGVEADVAGALKAGPAGCGDDDHPRAMLSLNRLGVAKDDPSRENPTSQGEPIGRSTPGRQPGGGRSHNSRPTRRPRTHPLREAAGQSRGPAGRAGASRDRDPSGRPGPRSLGL